MGEQHSPGPPPWAPSQQGECGAGGWTTNSLGMGATLGSVEVGRLSPSDPVIQLDTEGVSSQREILFSMLQAEEAGQSWLQFVVVSEPPPGTGGECEDVGFAYVDLREILLTGNDVLERDLDVVSPQDHSAIGRLKVSVEAAAALCAIYWEGRRKAEEEE